MRTAVRITGALVSACLFAVPAVCVAQSGLRLGFGARHLALPSGRWSVEQDAVGLALEYAPAEWLTLRTAAEGTATRLVARRLDVEATDVQARLEGGRRAALSHGFELTTHVKGPVRLLAIGEARWMLGSEELRVLELLLLPGAFDVSTLGPARDFVDARLGWWQASLGARLAVRTGPLDFRLDAGAVWARMELHYSLTPTAVALLQQLWPDEQVDLEGHVSVDEGVPYVRGGIAIGLPGPLGVVATAAGVPTRDGLAYLWTLELLSEIPPRIP